MTEQRTAGDILLSLEVRMERVEKLLAQIDIHLKTQINKSNIANLSSEPSPAHQRPREPLASMAQAKPVAGPIAVAPSPTMDDVVFPQAKESNQLEHRKSTVEQRVVYNDGRPVILASVTVAEAAIPTNIISKVKTDSHGKWHSQLFGGKYVVEVIKGPTAAKRGFKVEYEIEIVGDGKPQSLERKQIE